MKKSYFAGLATIITLFIVITGFASEEPSEFDWFAFIEKAAEQPPLPVTQEPSQALTFPTFPEQQEPIPQELREFLAANNVNEQRCRPPIHLVHGEVYRFVKTSLAADLEGLMLCMLGGHKQVSHWERCSDIQALKPEIRNWMHQRNFQYISAIIPEEHEESDETPEKACIIFVPTKQAQKNALLFLKILLAEPVNDYLWGLLLGIQDRDIFAFYTRNKERYPDEDIDFEKDKQAALQWIADNEPTIEQWVKDNAQKYSITFGLPE